MKLWVLGSGSGWPRLDRGSPSYLLNLKRKNLLLDMGPGSIKAFLKCGKRLEEIDYIFISHFHPDHMLDLIYFFFAMRYEGYRRKIPVFLIGPEGLYAFLLRLIEVFEKSILPPEGLVEIQEIPLVPEFSFLINSLDLKITTYPVKHRKESIGFRFEIKEKGRVKTIVYTGDTGFCENVILLSKKADLLITECAKKGKDPYAWHLSPEEIGEIASKAEVKNLLVSHFYPHSEGPHVIRGIRKKFSGRILLAEDFLCLNI